MTGRVTGEPPKTDGPGERADRSPASEAASAPRPRLLAIRHGETSWSRDRRHTGRTDLPLLAEGEAQAAALAGRLADQPLAAVLCSPRQRARRTAELAGLAGGESAPPMVVDPDLAEWDYGAYEGRTTASIRRERPGWDLFADGVPEGETIDEVAARADRVVARVLAAGGDVACVAHAHVLRVLAARWLGLEPSAARWFVLGPGSLSILGWEREHRVIEHWNT